MDVLKLIVSLIASVVALMFSCNIWAVGIGEIVLQSVWGDPLRARVDIALEPDEHIDVSCLSLAAPNPAQRNAGNFLTEANLFLKSDGKRQFVEIVSAQPVNKTFANLLLQVKCPGKPGIVKSLAISLAAPKDANGPVRPSSVVPMSADGSSVVSRTGKISDEELVLLLEQQKILATSFLDMQRQLKFLEEELKKIKMQLALPSSSSSSVAAMGLPAAGKQESGMAPDVTAKQGQAQQTFSSWQHELLEIAEVVLLGFLVAWLGLRLYARMKLRSKTGLRQDSGVIRKSAADTAAPQTVNVAPVIKQPHHVVGSNAPATAPMPMAGAGGSMVIPRPRNLSAKTVGKTAESNSMLEEASLYAASGRIEKAAEILQEFVGQDHSKENAWTLLLSLYSALGKAAEFEKTAREFLRRHKNSPSWSGIQVLGRTLDGGNPLYNDQSSRISSSPLLPDALNLRRPIGDILVEMGVLTKEDVLKYLDEFDPRKHGRFGGYLVARKAITLAQLDQALLQQQGVISTEPKHGDLPSLQEIEKLLDDFDPAKHGSVSNFLASRNIVFPGQLSQLLQQKANMGATNQ